MKFYRQTSRTSFNQRDPLASCIVILISAGLNCVPQYLSVCQLSQAYQLSKVIQDNNVTALRFHKAHFEKNI